MNSSTESCMEVATTTPRAAIRSQDRVPSSYTPWCCGLSSWMPSWCCGLYKHRPRMLSGGGAPTVVSARRMLIPLCYNESFALPFHHSSYSAEIILYFLLCYGEKEVLYITSELIPYSCKLRILKQCSIVDFSLVYMVTKLLSVIKLLWGPTKVKPPTSSASKYNAIVNICKSL